MLCREKSRKDVESAITGNLECTIDDCLPAETDADGIDFKRMFLIRQLLEAMPRPRVQH